jgi:Holliday junction DNA helicase RuvA
MIATFTGEVTQITNDSLVVRNAGIGLRIFVPTMLVARLKVGDPVDLHTYLVVREDMLSLYGFETIEERDFFVLLLGVNGVGPRIALSILSVLDPDAIRRAVVSEISDIFARVPGVGKKTAQKILLHLQGKIKAQGFEAIPSPSSEVDAEVISALTGLGYSVVEAQTALQAIPRDTPIDTEIRLRLALQYFSK